jgi:putative DNA primase/helicase
VKLGANGRPDTLTPLYDGIPDALTVHHRWVNWRSERRKGKWTKVPYNSRTGKLASTTDSETWSTLEEAWCAYVRGGWDGIGIVLVPPFSGVDLDDAVDRETGAIHPEALRIVRAISSYTEKSPSGRGLRIFTKGELPPGWRNTRGKWPFPIEMYDGGRYLTVTGHHLEGTPITVEERTAELATLHAHVGATVGASASSNDNGHHPGALTNIGDDELLDRARRARNGAEFSRLFDQGVGADEDHSAADFALCSRLAFWTGRDSARIDRLFRRSALMRGKWDEPHYADGRTYGQGTTEKAIASCTEVYGGGLTVSEDGSDGQPAPEPPGPYRFQPAFGPDHFVSQFIVYAAGCTDAPHEYHEASGLILLASATPNVRARLRQYPRGLTTAFYAILIGDSTRSRKSSSAGLALDLHDEVFPDGRLAEQASPEAFIEQLATRPGAASLWHLDEIGETLDKLHHAKFLAGLRGLILELYEGRDYRYKRTTKRRKDGTPVLDELVIERPHLSILGATTPSIFEIVTVRDINSGLMARFAVIMPASKPPRRPLEEPSDDVLEQRNELARRLSAIYTWAKSTQRRVIFDRNALGIIDRFAEEIESSDLIANERARAMLQRLNALTVKLAMLAAAGRPDATDHDALIVTPNDAVAAVAVARRWRDYAIAFAERVGETEIERLLQRALQVVRVKGRVPRRVIAQLLHCTKRTMDEIEATLVDRGHIVLQKIAANSGPETRMWVSVR